MEHISGIMWIALVSTFIYGLLLFLSFFDLVDTDINIDTDFAFGIFSVQNLLCIGMAGFWYTLHPQWYSWVLGSILFVGINLAGNKLVKRAETIYPDIKYEGLVGVATTQITKGFGLADFLIMGTKRELNVFIGSESGGVINKGRMVRIEKRYGGVFEVVPAIDKELFVSEAPGAYSSDIYKKELNQNKLI